MEIGSEFLRAAEMINDHSDGMWDDLLVGTELEIKLSTQPCSDGTFAMANFVEQLRDWGRPLHAAVGPRCSTQTMVVARIAGMEEVPLVSHSATNPDLSNTEAFPFFSRVAAPDSEQFKAVKALLRHFGWEKVVVLNSDTAYATGFASAFKDDWRQTHTDASGEWTGELDPATGTVLVNGDTNDLDPHSLANFLDFLEAREAAAGSRVVVVAMHLDHAEELFHAVNQRGTLKDTIWVGTEGWSARSDAHGHCTSPDPNIYCLPPCQENDNCPLNTCPGHSVPDRSQPSGKRLEPGGCEYTPTDAIKGLIGLTPFMNTESPLNQQYVAASNALRERDGLETMAELRTYTAEMVDALVAIATALDALPVEDRSNGSLVQATMRHLTFEGISGHVAFDENGDRADARYSINNMKDKGSWEIVGDVATTVGSGLFSSPICWPGEHGCTAVLRDCGPEGDCPADSHPCPEGHRPNEESAAVGCELCDEHSISLFGTACSRCPEGQIADSARTSCIDVPTNWSFVLAVLFLVVIVVGVAFWFWWNKERRASKDEMRDRLIAEARDNLEAALEDQKAEMEKAIRDMEFPDNWARDRAAPRDEWTKDEHGNPLEPPVVEGLVDVPITSAEYWDVHAKLRKTPEQNPLPQSQIDTQGDDSVDRVGMQQAWISSLKRVQNPHLYTYFDFQRRRLANPARQTPEVRDGWHGTGTFDAANIYEDKQDGFMMQFASKGQWGRGLYFAEEPGYSDFYATQGSPDALPDTDELQPDESEFMLANVLMGDVVEMDRDISPDMRNCCNNLVAPPFKDAPGVVPANGRDVAHCTQRPGHGTNPTKFNTVQGYTQCSLDNTCPRSRVWIVYENGRAYPQYVLRYYHGRRDPARTPHASAADAGAVRARTPPRPRPGAPGPVVPARTPRPVLPIVRVASPVHGAVTPPPLRRLAAVPAMPRWVVASQGVVPGAQVVSINGRPTPHVVELRPADANRIEEAWIRNRASVEYTGENGQNYTLTFADFIQRNRETGNPSQVHRLVNGNDSTWYARALRIVDDSGPNGERQFFVDRNTGRSTWIPNRLCPARPLSGVAAVALQL